jgi:hypothetical protein
MQKNITSRYASFLFLAFVLAACPPGAGPGGEVPGENGENGDSLPVPLKLVKQETRYDRENSFVPTVTFAFNREAAVQGDSPEGWTIDGNGTAVLAATPAPETVLVPGGLVTFGFAAAPVLPNETGDENSESAAVEVAAAVMPVSGFFARPSAGTAGYTVAWFDESVAAAGLVRGDGSGTDWLLVEEEGLRNLFNAVYAPNAPGTTDRVEQGKAAVPYTNETSATVLGLFKITVGDSPDGDRVEIAGAALPVTAWPPGDAKYHPVVIDIGLPDAPGGSLPAFYIPAGGLGAPGGDYRHIRLRVNRGAYLVIEADNLGGETVPCPFGSLSGGTVEAAGGGRLRNGAFRGFPLGEDTVIIARLGSRLAAGPEDADDAYFSGWLVGPSGEDARICWDAGDQNGSYIEIRSDGKLVFDTNITLRKPFRLRYDVWFFNSPTLTIGGGARLEAETGAFKCYGTFFQTGGQNPARPAAKILVRQGGAIARSLLVPDETAAGFVSAAAADIAVTNKGAGTLEKAEYGRDSISGYLNWDIPE